MPTYANIKRNFHQLNITWGIFNAFLIIFPISNGLLPGSLVSGTASLVLFIAFVAFLAFSSIISIKTPMRFTLPEWLLILFLVAATIATLHSVNIHLSIWGMPGEYGGLVPTVAYAILFLWVSRHINMSQQRQVIISMVIGSILPSIYGILQHTHAIASIPYLARSTSFFCNADFYGTYTAITMVLTLTLYTTTQHFIRRIGYLLLFEAQFIAITFSYTRSAWLGALIGMLFFGMVAISRNHELWKRFLLLIGTTAICFVIINHQSHNQVATRAASIASNAKQVVSGQNSNYAGSSRWYLWKESLPILHQHPLFGTGPDTFEQVFQPPHAGYVQYLDGQPVANANNAYLQTALTLGLPAFALLLVFYWGILRLAWREQMAVGQERSENSLLQTGLLATVICYLVQAFFNVDVVMVAPMFWVVLGVANRGIGVYSCSVI